MPVKQINTELGHSVPPEAPHNITLHIPGWDTAKALRRGDPELLSKLITMYPRFGPWAEVRELSTALHPLLDLPPTHDLILFTHPDTIPTAARYAASPYRTNPSHRIPPTQLLFRALDIPLTLPLPSEPTGGDADNNNNPDAGTTTTNNNNNNNLDPDTNHHDSVVRLYAVAYPLASAPGAVGVWQNCGIGISSRLAAALLPAVRAGRARVLGWKGDGAGWGGVPVPEEEEEQLKGEGEGKRKGGLPLGEGHAGLRRRIAGLVGGGGVVEEGDVWLYPTGMAAVYRSYLALAEESEGGMKHFGRCDAESGVVEAVAEWLEGEKVAGRKVGYIFAEFPSNPVLVSVDLRRLRAVADKYGVPVVIDDTIGSFCNIDVSPVADVIITSMTKSLSGYANVMGGSIILPPTSAHHANLKATLTAQFRNEYFHADALKLLANTQDYTSRSAILNRNALTLATFLHTHATTSTTNPATPSAITAVLYPPFTNTHTNYKAMMRRPPTTTGPDGGKFTPGYGCLMGIEFTSLRVARAFYDSLSVHHALHLGAHQTLAFPFTDAIWGKNPEEAAYVRTFGVKAEQVRVSVGLEDEEELLDTFRAALVVAERVWREEEEEKKGKGN
ncbi:pyridoxal phosphate-dependent transferase [Chaetomium fimeti]|uniref:Pyridoxal phosphate-dependent transferase n=1 Tax=Chaetomium fimeti TaxID=1854472 RepID=A0AAE0HQJ0_9PEZI|nr:pyridoxal phosphate-dependent transferase [Chaetomium fimeti]